MAAIFVHVSDIHFGQEQDDRVHIHDDVKRQVIADAAEVVRALPGGVAHGILVSGDVAFSGTREEYKKAGAWLDELADAVGCPIFRIQMVPGNHDLDRGGTSQGATHLLDVIRRGGAEEYEKVMSNELDRGALFARFSEYGRFSAGYDCGLDAEGRFSASLHAELAPGRAIRFARLNSSLLCTGDETREAPELMVGARQFTVPRTDGEELVALMHHPFHWLKDRVDVERYLKSRARVLITGHEHNPSVRIEKAEDGSDVLMLAAGATVPYKSSETYTFTYNVIEFDWEAHADALSVTIYPRAWSPAGTRFHADNVRLGGADPTFVLESPNFRKALRPPALVETGTAGAAMDEAAIEPVLEMVPDTPMDATEEDEGAVPLNWDDDAYRLLLLRFFRDLTEGERLRLLVGLDAIEAGSDQRMTQAFERMLLDMLVRQGKLEDVRGAVERSIVKKNERRAG